MVDAVTTKMSTPVPLNRAMTGSREEKGIPGAFSCSDKFESNTEQSLKPDNKANWVSTAIGVGVTALSAAAGIVVGLTSSPAIGLTAMAAATICGGASGFVTGHEMADKLGAPQGERGIFKYGGMLMGSVAGLYLGAFVAVPGMPAAAAGVLSGLGGAIAGGRASYAYNKWFKN